MKFQATARAAFTLIEVMIVMMIVAIVVSAGIPMVWKAMEKNQMSKAVHDVIEGTKSARDRAILHNRPYDFVVRIKGEHDVDLNVESAKIKDPSGLAFPGSDQPLREPGSLMGDFPRKIGDDVNIRMLDVNFVNHIDPGVNEARVRFFPNGTSDEFNIVLEHNSVQRVLRADIITGIVYEVTK